MEYKLISFKEGLINSDYPNENKEKIKLFIAENINKYKDSANAYLTFCFNKNIFVIKHCLDIIWKNKSYPIELLIYLPITFPTQIRIYIHKISNLEINPVYKEKNIIDFSTLEFYYQNIIVYTPLEDSITTLIGNIYNQFSKVFPLYKAESEQTYVGPCNLNKEKTFLLDIQPDDIKIFENLESIKKKMLNRILNLINTKSFEMLQAFSELEEIEKNIDKKLNNNYTRNKSKENIELEEIASKLKGFELKLKDEIYYLKNSNENKILERCNKVVKIKDEEKFKYTVMKKTIEDYFLYLKRGMDKKLVNFEYCKNRTRELSKELFFILYKIEQRNNQNNQ